MNYGSVIRFECKPGYVRTGDTVLLCQSNGTWSGAVPSCSKIQCRTFPEIENGWVSNRTRTYFFGDETRAQCYRGYKLNGTTVIRCGADGKFANVPTCLDVDECGGSGSGSTSSSPCDQASTTCTNVPGSYQCGCRSGFLPNLDCRPVVDLGLGNGGVPNPSISVSSAQKGFPKENVRLSTKGGWWKCVQPLKLQITDTCSPLEPATISGMKSLSFAVLATLWSVPAASNAQQRELGMRPSQDVSQLSASR